MTKMRFIHQPIVTILLANIYISVIIASNLKILNNSATFPLN